MSEEKLVLCMKWGVFHDKKDGKRVSLKRYFMPCAWVSQHWRA